MSTRVETSTTITPDKRVETLTRIKDKKVVSETTQTFGTPPRLEGQHLLSSETTTHKYLARCPDVLLRTKTTVMELLPWLTRGSVTPDEAESVEYKLILTKKRVVESVYEGTGRYVLRRKITTEQDYSEANATESELGFLFDYSDAQGIVTVEEWNDLGDGLTQYRRVKAQPTRRVAFTPNIELLTRSPSGIIGYNTLEFHTETSYEPPPTATCRGSGRDADEPTEEELERENSEPTRRVSTVTFPNSDDSTSTFPNITNPDDVNDPYGSVSDEDVFGDGTTPVTPTPKDTDGNNRLERSDFVNPTNDPDIPASHAYERTESDPDKKQGMPGKRSPRQVKEDAVDLTGARGVPILPKAATTGIERVTSPLLTMCTMDDRRAVRTLAAQIEQEAMYARKGASVTVSERQRGMAGFVWGDDVKRVGIEASEYITLTVEREGQ